MVLPPILGAMLLKVIEFTEAPTATEAMPTLALFSGFIVAFISGLVACQWMINLVKRGKLLYFAIYCFAISVIVITLTLT